MTERQFRPDALRKEDGTLDSWKRRVLLAYAQRGKDGIEPKFKEHKDVAVYAYSEKLGVITVPALLVAETRRRTIHAAEIARTFTRELRAMQAGATFNTKRVSNTPEILAELQVIFPDKSIEQIMALFSRPDGKLQANQPRRRTFARPIPLSKNASEVIPAPRAAAPKPVKIPMPEEPPTIITKIVELGDAWTDDSTPKVSEGRRGRAPSRERLQAGLDNYLSEAFRRSRGYTRKP